MPWTQDEVENVAVSGGVYWEVRGNVYVAEGNVPRLNSRPGFETNLYFTLLPSHPTFISIILPNVNLQISINLLLKPDHVNTGNA